MKKNKCKRILAVVLAIVMVAGTIAFTPQGAKEVQAAGTVKDINLGTGGLGNPESGASTWTGSHIYYAGKECYVLDKDGKLTNGQSSVDGNMLLLTKDVLSEKRVFDDSNRNSDWTNSTIRGYLNSTGFLDTMSSVEKESLTALSISTSNTTNGGYSEYPTGDTESDKIFLLDLQDVSNDSSYGFSNESSRVVTNDSFWWLRSPGNADNYAAFVSGKGYIDSNGYGVCDLGNYMPGGYKAGSVRPAFNLNLDSVLFSSASGALKSSFASVGTANVAANTWKLTLKDSSKTVNVTSGQSVSQQGQTVTVPYTYTGSDVSQISIMITDKAYTESDASILYYGALNTTLASSGTGTFTLPTGLSDGYKIYMMAEDVNETTLTDYSSAPVEIVPATPYDVTITNPADSHIEKASGTETQTGLTGAMTSVVYTAEEGYYFPTDYSVAPVNGIKVTRDNDTQITVSGTPTADVVITLVDATKKTDAPKTDAQKVEEAKTIVGNTMKGFVATNETTKESIQVAIDNALSAAGMTDVTVTIGNLDKTDATTSATGQIAAPFTISKGEASESGVLYITIAKLDDPNSGKVTIDTPQIGQGAPDTTMNNSVEDLKNKVLTDAEKALVTGGEDAKVYVEVKDASNSVSAADKTKVEAALGSNTLGIYLDVSLWVKVGNNDARKVTDPSGAISVSIKIPDNLINKDAAKTRTYRIIRVHNGESTVIEGTYDAATGYFTFETDAFSTYALSYSDKTLDNNSGNNNNTPQNTTQTVAQNTTQSAAQTSPQTGDNTPILPLALLLLCMGLVNIGVIYKKRHKTTIR